MSFVLTEQTRHYRNLGVRKSYIPTLLAPLDSLMANAYAKRPSPAVGEVQVKATRQETKVWYYQCDVTNVDQVHRVFEEAISQARYPFCGMVACAGISGGGPTIDFSAQEARRIIDINIMGTFICCQAAGKQFQKQNQRASVVLIASMSGHISNEVYDLPNMLHTFGCLLTNTNVIGGGYCSLQRLQICHSTTLAVVGSRMGFPC